MTKYSNFFIYEYMFTYGYIHMGTFICLYIAYEHIYVTTDASYSAMNVRVAVQVLSLFI